jgi:hypothetical protein
MKTRLGFVSNSSSSSYVIVTTKKAHEAAIKQMDPDKAETMQKAVAFKKMGNEEMVFVLWHEYNEGLFVYEWQNADKQKTLSSIDYEDDGLDESYGYWTGIFYDYKKHLPPDQFTEAHMHQ